MKASVKRRSMERKIVELTLVGVSLNQISKQLQVGKRRVRETLELASRAGYLDGTVEVPKYPEALFPDFVDKRSSKHSANWKLLEAQLPWIKERVELGWHAVTILEELKIPAHRSSFYRFLKKHKLNDKTLKHSRVVPEIVHSPGEALLIDWGLLWKCKDAATKQVTRVWGFVGVLGYSRQMVVKVMTTCDQAHTLSALREMYECLGGVPKRTTSDNPKVFATKADKYEAVLHPVYERFAAHYGTLIECLPPSDPQKKGKVERLISYVRRLLEAYEGEKDNISAIQSYLDNKVAIANQRRHGTTNERPIDRFQNEEQKTLKALPILPYDLEHYHEGTVRRDGHVRFLGKYYSVSEDYLSRDVIVIGNSQQISIYCDGKLIETHERVTSRGISKSTKSHHRKPWEQACDNHEGLKADARKIGTCVEQVVAKVILKGDGFIDYRKIWGILSLEKKYSNDEIDAACEDALAYDNLSYQAIKKFIIQAREVSALETLTESRADAAPGKYQRDLSEYKQTLLTPLLNLGKPKGDAYEH